jgi:hypothetical protein
MGREIRRVPPNWEHPKIQRFDYHQGKMVEEYYPLHDKDAQSAWEEWYAEYVKWLEGEFDKVRSKPELKYAPNQPYAAFYHWHGSPPDPEYCRPAWDPKDATWFQVYETVSEGTPVTPPFESENELIEYLVNHGDFFDQARGHGGWNRENAKEFVKRGSTMSIAVEHSDSGVTIKTPRDGS